MTAPTVSDVYYDPYDVDINADPYPVYRRLRDEAPVYYNDEYDFFAVSRADDVVAGVHDHETFVSSRGNVIELIKADMRQPSGTLVFEDPPAHSVHRRLLSRVFTPRRVAELEPRIRDFAARCLDPLVGSGGFDFVADLGAQMPMRVIGMLMGIPDADQEIIRDQVDSHLRTEPGKPMRFSKGSEWKPGGKLTAMFGEYIDWRAKNPSDDVMTDLLTAEFTDEHGVTRRLTRDEVLLYVNVVAGAGNETTNRVIGWAGKVLADNPEQRAELVADRSLVRNAVEELLRYENPGGLIARYVDRDTEIAGVHIPQGSAVLFLAASANRDERRFDDPDRFDIHRDASKHLTFGHGIHYCLGAALARIEARIAVEEVLERFPEWSVDRDGARMASASTVRGWDTLPVTIP